MKKLLTLGAAALLAVALGLPALADNELKAPDGPVKMQLTKKPVVFSHAVHARNQCEGCHVSKPQHFPPMTIDKRAMCVTCHHTAADGSSPVSCSQCHTKLGTNVKTVDSYYRIAHERNPKPGHVSCLSCHFEVIKTRPDKRVALTSCVGSACHPQ